MPVVTNIAFETLRLCLLSDTTDATSGAGVAYISGAPGFSRICFNPQLIFSVVLCVLYLSFVSFCWPWSCLSSDFMIFVCSFGNFEFLNQAIINSLYVKSIA